MKLVGLVVLWNLGVLPQAAKADNYFSHLLNSFHGCSWLCNGLHAHMRLVTTAKVATLIRNAYEIECELKRFSQTPAHCHYPIVMILSSQLIIL